MSSALESTQIAGPQTARVDGRLRSLQGGARTITVVLGVLMVLYHLAYLTNAFEYIHIFVPAESHRALSLAFILGLGFIMVPATKSAPRQRVPWYDVILALAAVAGPVYMFRFFWDLASLITLPSTLEVLLGVVTIGLVLEATRRTVGWVIVAIIMVFLLHPFFGEYLPGALYCPQLSISYVVGQLIYSTGGVYGIAMAVTSTIIFAFIVFSRFLHGSGAANFFISSALSLFGRVRGGPAKVAVVASSMLGTIVGSSVANVVSTGVFTIPLMRRVGYKPSFAGAVEAVSSTGGQLVPPIMGSAAFIAAELLEIPYITFAAAAVGPAILYYAALFMMVDLHAAKAGGLQKIPRGQLPRLRDQLKVGWMYFIPIFVLVYFLAVLAYSPVKSALYALASLVLMSMLRKDTRLGPKRLTLTLRDGAFGMLEIGSIGAGVGIIIGSVALTSLGLNLTRILVDLSGGNLLVLLVLAAAGSLVLGMGLPTVPAYILMAILVAPALIQMGVEPIVAHMFVFYFAIVSMITPPVCIAAYAAASIAEAPMFQTGFRAMQLGLVGLLVPFFFVFDPALLLIGSPAEIVVVLATGLVGALSLATGMSGFLLAPQNWLERLLFIGGGGLLMAPGLTTNVIGGGLLAIGIAWQVAKAKKVSLYSKLGGPAIQDRG